MNDVTLTVNGKPVSGVTEPRVTLLDFLRDVAGLKGTHAGCEHGVCGAHPNDNHVIISTDGDFAQLVAPNVRQYNGVSNTTITHEGYFDDKGERVIDKKTGVEKPAPDPQWLLFEKCMRGDTSDNIFSAYPGVRKKGTKNKVGLLEAYNDMSTKALTGIT